MYIHLLHRDVWEVLLSCRSWNPARGGHVQKVREFVFWRLHRMYIRSYIVRENVHPLVHPLIERDIRMYIR
jgi:hypothetical protein